MEVTGQQPRSASGSVTLPGPPRAANHYERQAAFVEWITQLFMRAGDQGIMLESLTDFELEWIGRM